MHTFLCDIVENVLETRFKHQPVFYAFVLYAITGQFNHPLRAPIAQSLCTLPGGGPAMLTSCLTFLRRAGDSGTQVGSSEQPTFGSRKYHRTLRFHASLPSKCKSSQPCWTLPTHTVHDSSQKYSPHRRPSTKIVMTTTPSVAGARETNRAICKDNALLPSAI